MSGFSPTAQEPAGWQTVAIDALDEVPEAPGVTLIEPPDGAPYLGKTRNLRRRLRRLLGLRLADGRTFGEAVDSASYCPVGSPFESEWRLWRTGRTVWPQRYRARLRLRPAPLLKAHLSNPYPRTSVTTQLSAGRSLYFGPFRSRAAAEDFQDKFLDFFGVRRCTENLDPTPQHPGCIYGEMGKCLRPCQEAVSIEQYRGEAGRLLEALHTRGDSLRRELEQARASASEELEFEEAARLHRRLERLDAALAGLDPVSHDVDRLHGVVIQRAAEASAVILWPLCRGFLLDPVALSLASDGKQISLDRRLREALTGADLTPPDDDAAGRQDSLALLRRWMWSSWREGELIVFEGFDRIPYRKLVNAVSRVVRGDAPPALETAAMRRAARGAAPSPHSGA
ncbi:MAG: hypothetical protein GC160_10960 [Acidobacteria bacterium]|nr:hypothetical protein [Acidobacteriota bacterium]